MKNTRKWIQKITVLFAITALTAVAITGCGKAHAKESATTGETKVIRFGDQANYFTTKVAIKKGFLQEEFGDEYTFELATFANGPAATEAFVAGQIDIGEYGDTPAVQAFANGTDIRIISTLWESDEAYALIAGANSGIETLADLKGKKLAYGAGTNPHKLLLQILASQNLSEQDVTLVNISSSEQTAALLKGDVDTIFASQPNIESTVEKTGGKVLTTNKDYETAVTLILADNDFATANKDTVARILKVFDKTNQWMAENQEEAAQIVADYNGVSPETVLKYYETREWKVGWSEDNQKAITSTIQFSYDLGNITTLFDADEIVDTTYLQSAGLYQK